jgi:5-(carboxyamino)imidazole ribonucleotide mutase
MPLVGIVVGSESDLPLLQPAQDILNQLGIAYELKTISAHRQPEKAREYALTAQQRGIEVIIAAAGLAAHLPGVLAGWTSLPVIGLPLARGELGGIDAFLSIVQMPPGIPVACVGINNAKNAALLAAEILALKYNKTQEACQKYRQEQAER